MLLNLHVKNFALIDEIEVDFQEHLNIMTGETGAGKSILIDSVNAALGGKFSKDMVRDPDQESLVELLFVIDDLGTRALLKEHEIAMDEDGQIFLTRRLIKGRSLCRINGEMVTVNKVKEIASLLIDLHGQHEHQSLMHISKHLDILDRFADRQVSSLKLNLEKKYKDYMVLLKELQSDSMDVEKRAREISFIEYELKEINDGRLIVGEDEELATRYKKISNSKLVTEILSEVYQYTGYDSNVAAGESIGRAVSRIHSLISTEKEVVDIKDQLLEIDSLINDFNRDLAEYLQDLTFDEEEFTTIEQRLNIINGLKVRYGNSIEKILEYSEELELKYQKLKDYDRYKKELLTNIEEEEKQLTLLCSKLTAKRKQAAKQLSAKIKEALLDLNFLDVAFDIEFTALEDFTRLGLDQICFMISTNPGEPMRPIQKVASGGELSRIMLAIKSVLADVDAIETLIFDEIDVGISGRTAQMVSERLAVIAKAHQVICITHLAQIAAMADTHYKIEKNVIHDKTITNIEILDEESSIMELARITSGLKITDQVCKSAKEMKELAKASKLY